MREKLIEILRKPIFPHELVDPTEAVADYLMDNGVLPVVRCKDCKYRRGDFFGGFVCRLHKGLAMVTDESFCSYGERKGE